uniref:Homoserine kinase n=1 Tax=Fervidicoccus fontis TaxID=683846 RepID=A0A7J3ZJZ7_9CREN
MSILVSSQAPSTIANLGCLFDLGGVAVDAFWDRVIVKIEESNNESIQVEVRGTWKELVPEGEGNIAFHALKEAFKLSDLSFRGIRARLILEKNVPVGKGLGSSAATIASTISLAIALSKRSISETELLKPAGMLEGLLAKSPHYDNVSAALLGGLVLLGGLDLDTPVAISLEWPEDLLIVLAIPFEEEVERPHESKTRRMREVLPEAVGLCENAVYNSYAILLLYGLLKRDLKLIGKAISYGGMVEKVRSKFIRGYWELKDRVLSRGAYGFNISGAGPSVFAISDSEKCWEVADVVESLWLKYYPRVLVKVSRVTRKGATSLVSVLS